MKTLTIDKLAAIILSVVFSVTAVAIAVPAIVVSVSVRESANTQPSEENRETLTDGGEAADEPSTAAPVETTKKSETKKPASTSSEFLTATDADFKALEALLNSNDTFISNHDCTSADASRDVLYKIAGVFGVYNKYFPDETSSANPYDNNYVPDPLNKYSQFGYESFSAAKVDYIAKNVFNTTIAHGDYESIYYYDGRVYAEFTATGKIYSEEAKINSKTRLSDGKYKVSLTITTTDFSDETGKDRPCEMIVALKNVNGKRLWSFYNVKYDPIS